MSRPYLTPDDEHNRLLAANVHPAEWLNPEPQPVYNIVVVGAGTAGLVSAAAAAALGGRVALVERHLMGGDCLNVGCVPSKSLIRSSRLAADMRDAASCGLSPAAVAKSDFTAVMERLRRIRARVSSNDSARRFRDMGVDVFLAEGRFRGPHALEAGGKVLRFKKAVIATGARALHPDIPGLEKDDYLTNETLFDLTERPDRLVVIGGGPIGCEIAQAFNGLGASVTVVQKSRLLPREEEEASALLAQVFRGEGIEVLLGAEALRVEGAGPRSRRIIVRHNGTEKILEADCIFIGAGRVPQVEGLGLEQAGVSFDARRGILVDDFLRTTNRNIYAAGDCCMEWKFTHAADAAAQIVVQNALFMGRRRLSALVMPWCTFTRPEIAHIGMYCRDAERQKIPVQVFRLDLSENDRAVTDGRTQGFVEILARKGGGKILGATIVGAHAGEMISEITTAMAAGMSLARLSSVVHPYPTQADAIRRTAALYNRSRLTPFVAGLFRAWLALRRLGKIPR